MSASQPALFNVQEFTDSGVTLVGGRLYTYAYGTTTQKVAYTDPEGLVPQTYTADGLGGQYIALNARGELPTPLYLGSTGSYDISLKRSDGSTVWTRKADGTGNLEFALTAPGGSGVIGNGGETVAQSFNALQLPDYAALRAYTGPRNLVTVSGYLVTEGPSGIAGMFTRSRSDTTTPDNAGTVIVSADGTRWKRSEQLPVQATWFGAKFDNATDDSMAMTTFCNWIAPRQLQGILPVGTAKLLSPVQVDGTYRGLMMRGAGWIETRFNYATFTSGQAAFVITGTPGSGTGGLLEGFGLDGNAGTNGIVLAGVCGSRMQRVQFNKNAFGVVFSNDGVGNFTEFNVVENCDFTLDCKSIGWYLVSATGDASFHGSGFRDCVVNNSGAGPVLLLSPRAFPYAAPLSIALFGHANSTIISHPSPTGGVRPYFIGIITLEIFAGTMQGCDTAFSSAIPLIGHVACSSLGFNFGSLFTCDGVFGNPSGSRQTFGARVSRTQAMLPGLNTVASLPYNIAEGALEYLLHFIGPNYDYRYKVGSFSSQAGGSAKIEATYCEFNPAGFGPPTFTLDESSRLVITNAGFPATGVVCQIDVRQIGQSVFSAFIE